MAIDVQQFDHAFLESAFDLATRVFVEGSTLHRALGIGLEEYRAHLRGEFESMVNEGHSVVALDQKTGELSGCLIVTDFCNQAATQSDHHSKFAPLNKLTTELCQQYLEHKNIQPNEAILVDMAAVAEHARGDGVYQRMRLFAQQKAHEKGFKSVVGELSSAVTQDFVLRKLGHTTMVDVPFDRFEYGGKFPFASIKSPKSIILTVGEL